MQNLLNSISSHPKTMKCNYFFTSSITSKVNEVETVTTFWPKKETRWISIRRMIATQHTF